MHVVAVKLYYKQIFIRKKKKKNHGAAALQSVLQR